MTTYADISDEHGEMLDPRYPKHLVHDNPSLLRWEVCLGVASEFAQQPVNSPEVTLLATTLFQSDIPTGEPGPDDLAESAERLEEGAAQFGFDSFLHPRDRFGKFIDTPDMPDMNPRLQRGRTPKLRNPGTPAQIHYTLAEIRAAGLDKWPEKGPKATEILGDAKDTAELYGPEEPGDERFPEYATDRKAGWLSLIGEELQGKVPPEGQPQALYMAGGTASGKSTVLRENRMELAPPEENTVHIDVDDIKEKMHLHGMPEYHEMREAGDRYAASAVHQESGDIAALMQKMAMDAGLNVIIDGTGDSDPGVFRNELEMVRDGNYNVDVLYVNRPVPESVSLAIARAERDGRFVPVEKIREIHKKTSLNFRDEIAHLDWLNSLIVYDQDGPIAAMDPNGKMLPLGDDEEARYADFVAKADATLDEKQLDEIEASDPLHVNEAASHPVVPLEEWTIDRPNEYHGRHGAWPVWQPQS